MMEKSKIKFTASNKLEFIVELRERVSNYFEFKRISEYGNWSLVLKTVIMLTLYFTPYFLMLTGVIGSFAGILVCWVIMGIATAGIGMGVMHDANHRSFSRNNKMNNFLGNTLYLLGGFPETWKHQHNTLHHGFTNIDGHDEDIDPVSFLRFSPHKPLKKIHRFQYIYAWFFYGLMTILWITTKDFKQLYRYKNDGAVLSNSKSFNQLLVTLIFAKVFYYIIFLIIPIVFLPIAWYWTIIFFLAMHFTSGFILTVVFQTAHVVPTSEFPLPDSNGTIENNWAVHQLFTTSDFSPKSRFLSWYVGGLNYQVEHHLFPNISHIHYRKISHIVEDTAKKYGLPYHVQPGFFEAVWEHAIMLKKLGRSYAT